jgi:hypothetical protein
MSTRDQGSCCAYHSVHAFVQDMLNESSDMGSDNASARHVAAYARPLACMEGAPVQPRYVVLSELNCGDDLPVSGRCREDMHEALRRDGGGGAPARPTHAASISTPLQVSSAMAAHMPALRRPAAKSATATRASSIRRASRRQEDVVSAVVLPVASAVAVRGWRRPSLVVG